MDPFEIHPGENALICQPIFQLGDDMNWQGPYDHTKTYGVNDVVLGRSPASSPSSQTSGTLVIGRVYGIMNYNAGDDFTNVGAPVNAACSFTATGTTPTDWSHGSTLWWVDFPLVVGRLYLIMTYQSGDDFTNVGASSNANGVAFTATGTTPADHSHGSIVIILDDFSVAYKALSSVSPNIPPPWPVPIYWEALPAELAASVQSLKLELVNDGKVAVSYLYETLGAQLTSGLLVVGKQYEIVTFNPGDDFTNVGASSNASGVFFTASVTTPTDWTHGSVLQQVSYPPNVLPADGLFQFELLDGDTQGMDGVYELRQTVRWIDTDYFASGGQADVLCTTEFLQVTPC